MKKLSLLFISLSMISVFSFISCAQAPAEYTLSFDGNGKAEVPSKIYTDSTVLTSEDIPSLEDIIGSDDLKTGFHFMGWYDSEETLLTPGYVVKSNKQFTAKWIDRVELNNSNYAKFNDDAMKQYLDKQLYICTTANFTQNNFHAVFFSGAYQNFIDSVADGNSFRDVHINAILDLSAVSKTEFTYLCRNVQKVILSKDCSIRYYNNALQLEEIEVPEDCEKFTVIDGILYNKAVTKIAGYPKAIKLEKLVIPSTLTSLVSSDINQQTSKATKEVVFHENFTEFNEWSFYGFTALEKVTFKGTTPPAMKFDTSRDAATFKGCSSDIKFYVPAGSKQTYIIAWTEWYAKTGYTGSLEDRIVEY